MSADAVTATVLRLLPDAAAVPEDRTRGQAVVTLDRRALPDALMLLKTHAETRFEMLTDLTAVDFLGRTPRFEVVYELRSLTLGHRLRVKIAVPEDDAQVPTATGVWKGANWAEREVWDMFGIRFAGHPDLRRILMYPEFTAHPLRKDYPVDRREPLVPERDAIGRPWFPRGAG